MDREKFDAWMETRPDCIKSLAKEFPLHTPVLFYGCKGKPWYVVGWNEDDMLLISPITLDEDYERAMQLKQQVCADHYR